jgi:hypothetical protein
MTLSKSSAVILGTLICLGLVLLGLTLGRGALAYKNLERTVTVKGLSVHEYPADTVIWPITYSVQKNTLEGLYENIDQNNKMIMNFLLKNGISEDEISRSSPRVRDKLSQHYNDRPFQGIRFQASQTLTVHSKNIETVKALMARLSELGKRGVIITGENYDVRTEYIFSALNEIKPKMIEEATQNARLVAEKFSEDSQSQLGKIKTARQGQFSITARDQNNPDIKKIRVVSTITYYLSD